MNPDIRLQNNIIFYFLSKDLMCSPQIETYNQINPKIITQIQLIVHIQKIETARYYLQSAKRIFTNTANQTN